MRTGESFVRQHLSLLGSPHEWILSNRHSQTVVINTLSFDQFYPYFLLNQNYRKQLREYEARQQYTLPNTPKIILVNNKQVGQEESLLLAQVGQFQFQKLISHYQASQNGQIKLVLQMIITIEMLAKKYGHFRLTKRMITASKGPNFLIWVNQNTAQSIPQLPIGPIISINLEKERHIKKSLCTPEHLMIHSFLSIICAHLVNKSIIQMVEEQNQPLGFEEVKKRLSKSIKDNIYSHITILTPESQKNRRLTEFARKKMPQFLLAKGKKCQSYKQKKQLSSSFNHQSSLSYVSNRKNLWSKEALQIKGEGSNQKSYNSYSSVKKEKIMDFMVQKLVHSSQRDNTKINGITSDQQISEDVDKIQILPFQIKKNTRSDQKHIFRQSGKSVSTNYAQYNSIHGSGKKFYSATSPTPSQEEYSNFSSLFRKNQKSTADSTFYRTNPTSEDRNRTETLKQYLRADCIPNTIEENVEQNNFQSQQHSRRTPRSPSILMGLQNSHTGTQKSISPGSQFYKDVDGLLQSEMLSPKISEGSYSLEGQFQKILFE